MHEAISSNEAAWNEVANRHRPYTYDNIISRLEEKGHLFQPDLIRALNKIGLQGKSSAVLSCNNGRSVMSLAKLGAAEAFGFDISDAFIQQGIELAEKASIKCSLIVSDTYKIPNEYNNRFDLLLITPGTLIYYPDLDKAFAVMSRLLKPEGTLLIHEIHPVLNMFSHSKKGKIMHLEKSYFKSGGTVYRDGLDYYSKKKYKSTPYTCYTHRMDEIIQASINNEMPLTSFEEMKQDVSGLYQKNKKHPVTPPKSFMLTAQKTTSK